MEEDTPKEILEKVFPEIKFGCTGCNKTALFIAFLLTLITGIVEFFIGLIFNSLSLRTDSYNMVYDAAAIGTVLLGEYIIYKKESDIFTFGFRRTPSLFAFINGIALISVSATTIMACIERLVTPSNPEQPIVILVITSIGLLVNFICLCIVIVEECKKSQCGAVLNILVDFISSLAPLVSSIVEIAMPGSNVSALMDPIFAIVASLVIIIPAIPLLLFAAKTLLLAIPNKFNIEFFRTEILNCDIERIIYIHVFEDGKDVMASVNFVPKKDFSAASLENLKSTFERHKVTKSYISCDTVCTLITHI